jgi:hypothetical protein
MKRYGQIPAEKHRKSLEHGSSIPLGKFSDFFRRHPTNFLFCPTEIDHKASKKFQKLSKTEYCFQAPAISGVFIQDTMMFPAMFLSVSMKSDYFQRSESSTWATFWLFYNSVTYSEFCKCTLSSFERCRVSCRRCDITHLFLRDS